MTMKESVMPPYAGPRRPTAFRLGAEEQRTIREVAEQLPRLPRGALNLSEALRYILGEWAAGRGKPEDDEQVAEQYRGRQLRAEIPVLRRQVEELQAKLAELNGGAHGV